MKLLILTVFSSIIIYFYYFGFPVHQENFDGYSSYMIIIWIIYSAIKYLEISFWGKRVSYTPFKMLMYFLLHLFVLSILFFSLNGEPLTNWIILFFKIVFYAILPAAIIFITTSFWKKILSYIKWFNDESDTFKFILSIWVWFFSFMFLLTILWVLGFYNSMVVSWILLWFIVFSYKQIEENFDKFMNTSFSFDNHNLASNNPIEKLSLRLLTTQWLFIIATLIISISLINIVRPFPIGWDDLWAYMNIPRLIADAWVLWGIWGMISWQTFTWIWFLFGSTTQAFFLNNVWGILSLIVTTLVVWEFLKTKKETFINIPLLIWTIFISMPMVVFQQAKDMKLDTGLFFISVIVIYLFYYLYHKPKVESKNVKLVYFLIIWLLAGFAFSIKFTSLILISAIIWILFYVKLGKLWFLWYLAIYFAIFTWGWLWAYMNVVFPNTTDFKQTFWLVSWSIWLMLLIRVVSKNMEKAKLLFSKLVILILWIIIALLPWFSINIYHSYPDISIWTLLSWKAEVFTADYTKIYSKPELEVINNRDKSALMSSSWTTKNEDFWRYFWYEKWANNYLKLPWNLTMQKNQGGEFTWITFLFLALLPALLLFLPYRRKYFKLAIVFALLFELALFVFIPTSTYLTTWLATFNMPFGYTIILWFFLFWLLLNYMLKESSLINIFKINLVLTLFYTFLWAISAFWIVWYGITMYFWFLMMIAIWIYYMVSYNEETNKKELLVRFFGSIVLIIIIWIHFFFSVFPHSFNNLKSASYSQYKTGKITEAQWIFLYHSEYLKMLFAMNIADDKKEQFILDNLKLKEIKNLIKANKLQNNIAWTVAALNQLISTTWVDPKIKKSAEASILSIYTNIASPDDKYKSKAIIYRLWTFLKYFITENNKRIYEDSLVTLFDKYIYNSDINKTVDNMKKLGLSYLLTDLNAATIDRDPRHDLTRRYELLLKTFTSDKLELIETDSICLKIALEDYKKSDKSAIAMSNYMIISGVNYESYPEPWKVVNRRQKQAACYKYIDSLVTWNKIDNKNYNYLLGFTQFLVKNKITDQNQRFTYMQRFFTHWYKALFKIK